MIFLKRKINNLKYRLFKLLNSFGKRKQCYICRKTFFCFKKYQSFSDNGYLWYKNLDTIGSDINNFSCPFCFCHDRERHFFAYFDKLNLWPKENAKILHFAPENHLYKKFTSSNLLEYIKADWEPELYINRGIKDVKKINLMGISFADNHFDIVICNHVLEHIPNMQKGLAEIHRVLKNGGIAILQTPFSRLLHKHFEDTGITTDEQRIFFNGQRDHVRIVSEKQFFEDLENTGFKLAIVRHEEVFDSNFAKIYGVNPKEDLIMAVKV
jgi:SAM-dependent methyltransferase